MRRGEVWWHEPPDDKRRPVLILTRHGERPLTAEEFARCFGDLPTDGEG